MTPISSAAIQPSRQDLNRFSSRKCLELCFRSRVHNYLSAGTELSATPNTSLKHADPNSSEGDRDARPNPTGPSSTNRRPDRTGTTSPWRLCAVAPLHHPCRNTAGAAPLIDRRKAAQYLSISQRSLDYLLANGELHTRRIGARVLIPISELQRYAQAITQNRSPVRIGAVRAAGAVAQEWALDSWTLVDKPESLVPLSCNPPVSCSQRELVMLPSSGVIN